MADVFVIRDCRKENNPSQSSPLEHFLEITVSPHSLPTRLSEVEHDLERHKIARPAKELDSHITDEAVTAQPDAQSSLPAQPYDHVRIGLLEPTSGALHLPTDTSSNKKSRSIRSHKSQRASLLPKSAPEPAMSSARLFIASLGNPAPLASTRHSAGHVLLKSLQSYLSLPLFTKSKPYANGLTSLGADVGRPEYTLWQSPSFMNVSGTALLKAYKAHCTATQSSPNDPLPGLVILYDEMEMTPSQLKVRSGTTSAKGHNGLKSVLSSLQSAGLSSTGGKLGDRFVKIGVGIGRPAGGSRDPDDVSCYVLAQLTSAEKDALEAKTPELARLLEQEMRKSGY